MEGRVVVVVVRLIALLDQLLSVVSRYHRLDVGSSQQDDVFVGRVRLDNTQPRTLNMWIVADNLRKGAATNAVQIAEYLVAHKLV